MREIKFLSLEKRDNDTRNYKYSIFICPSCNKEVVKKSRVGKNKSFALMIAMQKTEKQGEHIKKR